MSPERLLQHFDQIAEAPDAVPRLRRFILDLAVRGKLVEQNPEDEPASKLLKRIREKRGRMSRHSGNVDCPIEITEAELPFEIPENWEWVPSTEPAVVISDKGKKVQTKDVLEFGKFPVVDQGRMFIRGYCNDAQKVIRIDGPIVVFGDHTRETKLIDFDFVVGADGVKLLKPIEVNPAFYFLALQWIPLESRGYGRHFKLLRASRIPLPPLAEQHRIVAKVDELMALCNALEAAKTRREKRRDKLVAATLHGLSNGDESGEPGICLTIEDSARFYFNHLPRLTTRPEHIQQLRQTILNLAVRGKLVPQDPADEPATEILKRVEAEKRRRIEKGEIRKPKQLGPLSVSDYPFEIPLSWAWIRLGQVAHLITKGSTPTSYGHSFVQSGINFIKVEAIKNGRLSAENVTSFITEETHEFLKRSQLAIGDFLFSIAGSIGTCAVVNKTILPANTNQALAIIRGADAAFLVTFLQYLMRSCLLESALAKARGGAMNNISLEDVSHFPLPIPPFAEQHRIVAKVDELMALCDKLEAQLTNTATTRRHFIEATLQDALSA